MMNDDCLSPLGVAREKGYANVVRTIEVVPEFLFLTSFFFANTSYFLINVNCSILCCCCLKHCFQGHICLFSGWLREFYGPGFLGLLAPQLLSRKVSVHFTLTLCIITPFCINKHEALYVLR